MCCFIHIFIAGVWFSALCKEFASIPLSDFLNSQNINICIGLKTPASVRLYCEITCQDGSKNTHKHLLSLIYFRNLDFFSSFWQKVYKETHFFPLWWDQYHTTVIDGFIFPPRIWFNPNLKEQHTQDKGLFMHVHVHYSIWPIKSLLYI